MASICLLGRLGLSLQKMISLPSIDEEQMLFGVELP